MTDKEVVEAAEYYFSDATFPKCPLNAFRAGVAFIQKQYEWISIKEKLPEQGIEVLLFNENWKDEDYNTKGIRIGFLDGLNGFISAHWWNYQDCYMTISKDECLGNPHFSEKIQNSTEPTHWKNII